MTTHTTSPNNGDAERARCEVCKGKGEYRQTYTAGCGGGSYLAMGRCDYCKGSGQAARRSPVADAAGELPAIEYDRDMQRTYIPLPGGWEMQTKGTGSTFRIANTQQRSRWPVLEERLHEVLEALARDTRNALASKEAEISSLRAQLADAQAHFLAQQDMCEHYRQLARTSAPEGAPVGMVLVPVEPTREMVWACKDKFVPRLALPFFVAAYKTMIAAAPTSASAQPAEVQEQRKTAGGAGAAPIEHNHSEGGHHD